MDELTPPYIANLIRGRAAHLGWSIDDVAALIGAASGNFHRALAGHMRSDLANRAIAALGGLRSEIRQGEHVLVWGDPPRRPPGK